MTLGEYVLTHADRIARETAQGIRSGRLQTMGEVEEFVSTRLGSVTDALVDLTQPAVQKAVEAIKPAIMEALQEYTPTFAAVSGGMLALAVLLGVWVSRETFKRVRGGRR